MFSENWLCRQEEGEGEDQAEARDPINRIDLQEFCDEDLDEDLKEAADVVDAAFLVWREKFLRCNYKKKYTSFGEEPDKAGEDEYVLGGDANYPYRYENLPGHDFFRKKMLPTLLTIAKTPGKLKKVAAVALAALDRLMVAENESHQGHTPRELLHGFFSLKVSGRFNHRRSDGQFKYFYNKYGAVATEAIALWQGWNGDRDHILWADQIERLFDPAYTACPPQHRDAMFRAFIRYRGEHYSVAFLEAMPQFLARFIQLGKENLLGDFFDIAEEAPEINISDMGSSYGAPPKSSRFPVVEPDDAIEELEALQRLGEHKNAARSVAKNLLRHCNMANPTFVPQSLLKYPTASPSRIADLIHSLEAAGYTPEKIDEICYLWERNQWLESAGDSFVSRYPEIDRKFPGGVGAALEYAKKLRNTECVNALFSRLLFSHEPDKVQLLPEKNSDKYLEIGVELAVRLGAAAAPYFELRGVHAEFSALLAADLEGFSSRVFSGADLVDRIPALTLHARKDVFQHHLDLMPEGKEKEFGAGVDLILNRAGAIKPAGRPCFSTRYSAAELHEDALSAYHDAASYFGLFPASRFPDDGRNKLLCEGAADYLIQAKIAAMFVLDKKARFAHRQFLEEVSKGMDWRLAAMAQSRMIGGRRDDGLEKIEGAEFSPELRAAAQDFLDVYLGVQDAIAQVYQCRPDSIEYIGKEIRAERDDELQRNHSRELYRAGFDNLKRQIGRMDGVLATSPAIGKFINADGQKMVDALREEARQAMQLALLKDHMGAAIRLVPHHSTPFLDHTNPHTRTAIICAAALAAVGALNIPGVSDRLVVPASGDVALASPEQLEGVSRMLRANIRDCLLAIEQAVLRERMRTAGQMPIGAKVHVMRPIPEDAFAQVSALLGMGSTPFRLIHAGKSINLPPMVSALETSLLIVVLERFGFLNRRSPDLQFGMGGRLNADNSAIFGASTLLATDRLAPYKPGAFSTTHDHLTGARFLAYDDGVKESGLPYDLREAKGRTDRFGSIDHGDAEKTRFIGNLLEHAQFGHGPLRHLGETFKDEFAALLRRNGLLDALHSSAWVYGTERDPADTLENHEAMVGTFTQAWLRSNAAKGRGLMGDMDSFMAKMRRAFNEQQRRIVAAKPGEFDRLMRY